MTSQARKLGGALADTSNIRGPYTRWSEARDGTRRYPQHKDHVPHIGENIRLARLAAGKTQPQLAAECGMGRTLLTQIETGKKFLVRRHWLKLKKALPDLAKLKVHGDFASGRNRPWDLEQDGLRRVSLVIPEVARVMKTKPAAKKRKRK